MSTCFISISFQLIKCGRRGNEAIPIGEYHLFSGLPTGPPTWTHSILEKEQKVMEQVNLNNDIFGPEQLDSDTGGRPMGSDPWIRNLSIWLNQFEVFLIFFFSVTKEVTALAIRYAQGPQIYYGKHLPVLETVLKIKQNADTQAQSRWLTAFKASPSQMPVSFNSAMSWWQLLLSGYNCGDFVRKIPIDLLFLFPGSIFTGA